MRYRATRSLAVLCCALLVGCASSLMRKSGAGPSAVETERVQVIFMRPSNFGGAIQASVFDLRPDSNQFVGIVSSGTKVAYLTDPGQHRFMVIGENADFMEATLAPGKTYYALVTPRFGWWKARFSLRPVHRAELDGSQSRAWDTDTTFAENTSQSEDWARSHAASIESKKTGYLVKWNDKSASERAENELRQDDGR